MNLIDHQRWLPGLLLLTVLAGCEAGQATPTLPFAGSSRTVADTSDAGPVDVVDANDEPETCSSNPVATRDSPMPLATDGATALELCGGDGWWAALDVLPGDRVVLRLADPDASLGLAVWRADGGRLAEGRSRDGELRVTLTVTEAFRLLVEVRNPAERGAATALTSHVDRTAPACEERDEEPNDRPDQARPLAPGAMLEGTICDLAPDVYRVDLEPGHTATIDLHLSHAQGDLDMLALLDVDGDPLAVSESATDLERLSLGPFDVPAAIFVQVYGWNGSTGPYTLSRTDFGEPDRFGTVSGRFVYEDRPSAPEGVGGPLQLVPARNLVVEVVRQTDGVAVASGTTDLDGQFALTWPMHEGHDYAARGLCRVVVGGLVARVVDRGSPEAEYAVLGEPLTGDDAVVLKADALGIGGAVNIVDVLGEACRSIAGWTPRASPPLTVQWQQGLPFGCGSCYGGNRISLGGQPEDPDEYDDDIILHEFGHHFVAHYSRDSSMGGTHRDRLVVPTLAYGEGLAYFLAGLWGDDPIIEDTFLDDARRVDLESGTIDGQRVEEVFGTANGALDGLQREELVAGILWDAYDPFDPEEPFDTLEIGVDGHMEVLVERLGAEVPPPNVGPPGIDLSDWLHASACLDGDLEPWAALSSAWDYPWPTGEEGGCAGKGIHRPFRLVRRGGVVWLEAVAHDANAPGAVRRYRGEAAIKAVQPEAWVCDALPCAVGKDEALDVVVTGRINGAWFGASSPSGLARPARPAAVWSPHGPVRAWPSVR